MQEKKTNVNEGSLVRADPNQTLSYMQKGYDWHKASPVHHPSSDHSEAWLYFAVGMIFSIDQEVGQRRWDNG